MIHALGTAFIDDALGVAENDIFRRKAHRFDEIKASNACRTRAIADKFCFLDVAAGEFDGVQNASSRYDRGAMLVIVKDRNVHQFAQALFDDETFRRANIFEIDAAEARPQIAHGIDEFVRVFCFDLKINGVDIGKAFEENGLAFHHGLGGECTEIAEPQDRGAIGDDGHQIAFGRVIISGGRVFRDGNDGHRHARRIGERQIALCRHRLGGDDFELAGPPARVELQRFLICDGRALRSLGRFICHCLGLNCVSVSARSSSLPMLRLGAMMIFLESLTRFVPNLSQPA